MYKEKISVVMSTFNEPVEWVAESTLSILQQTHQNLEFIIIVDNPDNKLVINYLKLMKKKDSRIKLIINTKNMGLIFSLNIGIQNSSGDYIARMDADDISMPNRFEVQLNYLKKNKLDLIGSNVSLFNSSGVFHTTDKLCTHAYLIKQLKHGSIGIVHPTFFGKIEVFRSTKGYNPSALHAEDMEIIANAISQGYLIGNTNQVLLQCRYTDHSVTKTHSYRMYLTAKSITASFKKYLKGELYDFQNSYEYEKYNSERFNKKQKLLTLFRTQLNSRQPLRATYTLLKAIITSSSTLSSIRNNIFLKIYKIQENIQRNDK